MSDKSISWFHCGRCGSLFQAHAGDDGERLCSSCGRSPSLGLELVAPPESEPARTDAVEGVGRGSGNREIPSIRKRKRSYFMAKLVAAWVLVLLAIVFGARQLWHDRSEKPKPVVSQETDESVIPQADVDLLNEAGPLCGQTFISFLAAKTPEERNQFVLSPITTAARMARYYSLNPLVSIDPATLSLTRHAVLQLPGQQAIETQWTTSDGRTFDAIFLQENGEWRLDWDHYVRFSEYPWALFLAGSEEDSGEFRLLARERLADERKNAEDVSIVLYAPRFGFTSETGHQSPEFLVKRDTRNGRLLDAAFQLERDGKRPFGVRLPSLNPEGMIRVRAKVRRIEQDLERRYELEEVIACHWYSVDEAGVEIPEQQAEK